MRTMQMTMPGCTALAAALVAGLALHAPALAQGTGTGNQPAAPEARQATPGGESNEGESYGGPLLQRGNLLGDPLGLRSAAARHGLTFGLAEAVEVLGNPSGGIRRGAVFEGLLAMSVGLDTKKAGLWDGGTFNASSYQIHGRGLSLNNLGNNGNTVSGIEALRGTLLFELWYEQALLEGKLGIRVGQLAADQEFQISQYGNLFINHTFGWSTLPSADLSSGGPAYPLATPGVRIRYVPREDLAFLLSVLNGDAARPGIGIPQARDPSGTAFRLDGGVFVIGEVQTMVSPYGLAGTYKLGATYNSNAFADQRFTSAGASLADPQNLPGNRQRQRRNNWSIYAVADQLVWHPADIKDGIGTFLRLQGAPGDRNLVNFYVDAGVTWKGIIPNRTNDTAGIAFGLARNSDTATKLDADVARLINPAFPRRRFESVLEVTYQAQIAPWFQIQPTAQYIFNINGGVLQPGSATKRVGDAAVFGLRTNVAF